MKQTVAHKKMSALHGLLVVAGLVAVLVALNYLVLGFLATHIGNGASSIAFWVLGVLIAWSVLRVYIVKYNYEMDDEVLYLSRSYGKRERYIDNVYLNRLVFMGAPGEAKKRFPNAARVKACHVKGEDSVVALVYSASDGNRIALFQPNEEIKAALRARLKEK